VNLYLDTSSLLKLYLLESGTPEIQGLRDRATVVATSLVAYPETRAGLARALRSQRLTPETYGQIFAALEADWVSYLTREVTDDLVHVAGDLAAKHFLRGFDAIHLASAVTLQQGLGEPVAFSSADARLIEAATAEGLALP
jgi:predicted nucleic acid-binding protein